MSETLPQKVRRHLFVDPKVQGALVIRVVLYWFVSLFAVGVFLLCWRVMEAPKAPLDMHCEDLWTHYGPACLASLILLPLVIVDLLRLSNRFVGPLLRLRRSMRKLARGEYVEPILFREDDFWRDFAEEFNAVVAKVQKDSPTAIGTDKEGVGDCETENRREFVVGASR